MKILIGIKNQDPRLDIESRSVRRKDLVMRCEVLGRCFVQCLRVGDDVTPVFALAFFLHYSKD